MTREPARADPRPAVSLVVPALDAEPYLPRLHEALARQSSPPHEVVLVDSRSADRTEELARGYGWRVISIDRADFSHGGTRNLAARHATGDILVFLSQDALPHDEHWLAELIRPLAAGIAGASYSRQVPSADTPAVESFARRYNYPNRSRTKCPEDIPELGVKAYFFSNASSAVLRPLFEQVGGFREDVILAEDMLLAVALMDRGHCIHYAAESVVEHAHGYGFLEQLRRNFDIGAVHVRSGSAIRRSGPGSEGARFAARLMSDLVRSGRLGELPGAALDILARTAGYALGRSERWLPSELKRRLSMNPSYWDRDANSQRPP